MAFSYNGSIHGGPNSLNFRVISGRLGLSVDRMGICSTVPSSFVNYSKLNSTIGHDLFSAIQI